jgi:hypothetical protein
VATVPRSASVTLLSQARVRIKSARRAHRAPVLESSLSEALAPALDQLFHQARTLHGWTDRPVEQALLVRLYETLRMAPTAFNSQPLRLICVTSPGPRSGSSRPCSPVTWSRPARRR